ncbi:MAG: DUF4230 domain-containing protein [Flavobacteriales bacterium]|nr:DUF4230 domain-containing protein [Flavobacteriales bacterium]
MSRIARVVVLLAVALLVFFITREVYRPSETSEVVNSTIMLKRVRTVLKLVTVEGEFNELYDHADSWNWRYAVPGFTEKRAILRVKARVSVGYDLEGLQLTTDERTRTITIQAPPSPSVLSLEHDIDYYDLNEGLFNHFDERELTRISNKAKERIRDQVGTSGLYEVAEEQRDELLDLLRTLVESNGWKLELGWESKDARSRLKG